MVSHCAAPACFLQLAKVELAGASLKLMLEAARCADGWEAIKRCVVGMIQ